MCWLSRLVVYYFIDLLIDNPKYGKMQKHRAKSKKYRKIVCASFKVYMQIFTLY